MEGPKTVLVYTTAYLPFIGGAELALKEITDRWPETMQVTIITARLLWSLPRRERIGRVDVIRIGYGIPILDKLLLVFFGKRVGERTFTDTEPNCVWAIMASYGALAASAYKRAHPRVQFLLTLQEGDSLEHIKNRARFLGTRFREIFERADSIQAISQYLARWARREGAHVEPEIIPNGVNLESFSVWKSNFGGGRSSTSKSVKLITTSRLVKKNAVDDIIRALAHLNESVTLTVVGDGVERVSLKVLTESLGVKNRVHFLGTIAPEAIPQALAKADIFVRPSLSEGLGNSFLEAFAAGLPVIATPVGGITDFLIDGKTGWFAEVRNPESIASCVRYIIDPAHRAHVERVRQNARTLVEREYSWEGVADHLWRHISSLTVRPMKRSKQNIAVIGGGFFGCTAAAVLAEAGHHVELYEAMPELLSAASGINQFRLHRGYHYPRSRETAEECLAAEAAFIAEFPGLVSYEDEHYYCIAREGSKVTPEQFAAFCDALGLEYTERYSRVVDKDALAWSVQVHEGLIRIDAARAYLKERLAHDGVTLHLGVRAEYSMLERFDHIVLCTYAESNSFLSESARRAYQYELCEKLVLSLPEQFARQSIVIMDGPFTCIDPLVDTPYHLMGNVVHAIHHSSVGIHPQITKEYAPLLNAGIIKNPPLSNVVQFIGSAERFFPAIRAARHVGSMFTIRTVLPDLDATDARLTLVEELDERIIRVFSGKIGNCVPAAYEVKRLIEGSHGKPVRAFRSPVRQKRHR